MSTIVERNQDISQVENGEFIFCKELSKGFIKRDISELSSVQFEAVANEIEALSLEVLNTLGLDSVQFGDKFDDLRGEMKIATRVDTFIEDESSKMTDFSAIWNFNTEMKSKRRYFDEKSGGITLDSIGENFDSIKDTDICNKFDCVVSEDSEYGSYEEVLAAAQAKADEMYRLNPNQIPVVTIKDNKFGQDEVTISASKFGSGTIIYQSKNEIITNESDVEYLGHTLDKISEITAYINITESGMEFNITTFENTDDEQNKQELSIWLAQGKYLAGTFGAWKNHKGASAYVDKNVSGWPSTSNYSEAGALTLSEGEHIVTYKFFDTYFEIYVDGNFGIKVDKDPDFGSEKKLVYLRAAADGSWIPAEGKDCLVKVEYKLK